MRAHALLFAMLISINLSTSGCVTPHAPEETVTEATGGLLVATSGRVFEPACNETLDYEADVIDLNGDGQPEVFTAIHGLCLGGSAGVQTNLYVKDSAGDWQPQFGFPGIPHILRTGSGGFPDIEIGGPGFCFPVWRWDGRAYALHKSCPL